MITNKGNMSQCTQFNGTYTNPTDRKTWEAYIIMDQPYGTSAANIPSLLENAKGAVAHTGCPGLGYHVYAGLNQPTLGSTYYQQA